MHIVILWYYFSDTHSGICTLDSCTEVTLNLRIHYVVAMVTLCYAMLLPGCEPPVDIDGVRSSDRVCCT